MLGRLFKNTLLFAIGPQVPRLISVFLLPLLTKYLTPVDYGIWGIVTAYTGFFAGLKTLGMSQVIVNVYFKNKLRWKFFWQLYMGLLYSWILIFVLIQAVILWFVMPSEVQPQNKLWIILLLSFSSVFFDVTNTFGFRLYQFRQQAGYIALVTAISGVVTLLLNVYTIVYLKLGYMGWAISSFVGGFCSFAFLFYPVHIKEKLRPLFVKPRPFFKSALRVALPTIPHDYSAYLLNVSDRLVMDFYKVPISQIGMYNFAYTFGNYAEVGGEAMGMALSPMHLKLLAEKKENKARKLIFSLQLLFILGLFIVGMWAKEILQLLISNPDLANAYLITALIVFSYSYRPLYWGAVNLLGFAGRTEQLWKISFIAGILNLGLNFAFMPIWGYMTAIVTTFLSLLFLGVSGYHLKVFKQLSTENYRPFSWLAVFIAGFILLYFAVEWHFTIKILITVCLMTILWIVLRKTTKELA